MAPRRVLKRREANNLSSSSSEGEEGEEGMSIRIHPESEALLRSLGLMPGAPSMYDEYSHDPPRPEPGPAPPMSAPLPPQPQRQYRLVEESPRPVRRDVAGIHAILTADTRMITVQEVPRGGQLSMQSVVPGDALIKVDGIDVSALSLRAVRAVLEGPSFSTVLLDFERGGELPFSARVVRVPTVSEDVQVAVMEDALRQLSGPSGRESVDSGAPRYIQELQLELSRGVQAARAAAAASNGAPPGVERALKEAQGRAQALERKLAEQQAQAQALIAARAQHQEQQQQQQDGGGSSAVSIAVEDAGAGAGICEALAEALGVPSERFVCVGVHGPEQVGGLAGCDVTVHEGGGGASKAIAEEIARQASDPQSRLRRESPGVRGASVSSERALIERLRATIKAAQTERDDARAAADEGAVAVANLRQHNDERSKVIADKTRRLEQQLADVTAKLRVEQEARKLQAEASSHVRTKIDQDAGEELASLSQHVASQKTAIHDLEARLSAAQSDMRKAQQRADKAGEEAELLRVSQRRMEGEIVLIASQTSTVFGTSERQLEQAKTRIVYLEEELKSMQEEHEELLDLRARKRVVEAEASKARREAEQNEHEVRGLHRKELDLVKMERDEKITDLMGELAAANHRIQEVTGELSTRMATQKDIGWKLAAQEQLSTVLVAAQKKADDDRDRMELELKAASVKVVTLQDEVKLLAGRCAALDEQNYILKVDANQWRRVDKLTMEKELAAVKEVLSMMQGQGKSGEELDYPVEVVKLRGRVSDLEYNQSVLEAQALKDKALLEAAGLRAAEAAAEARARGEEVRGMYTEPVRDGTGNEKVEELEGEVARLTALNRKLKDEREGELDRVQKQLQSEIDKCQTDLVNSQAEASQLRANVSSEQASGKRMRDEIDIHKFAVEADKKLIKEQEEVISRLQLEAKNKPVPPPETNAINFLSNREALDLGRSGPDTPERGQVEESVRVQTLQEKLRVSEEAKRRAENAALSWKNAYEKKGPLGLW